MVEDNYSTVKEQPIYQSNWFKDMAEDNYSAIGVEYRYMVFTKRQWADPENGPAHSFEIHLKGIFSS